MTIEKADKNDLSEILKLQIIAYQTEAELLNDFSIQPLKQTLSEIEADHNKGIILKALYDGNIIGSVRGYLENDTLYIGKLFVHPSWRGRGVGTKLLKEIEQIYPHGLSELFTSSKSINNLRLYVHVGYRIFKEKKITDELTFVYFEKQIKSISSSLTLS